jgi:uncharacterized protein
MRIFANFSQIALVCLVLLLSGCSMGAQGLQTSIVTIQQGNTKHKFTAEVAITPAEQAQGLMNRTDLADDAAMLFPFENPKIASFWMKNTLIPLDMFFIRADGTIDRIAENTIPNSEMPVASGREVSAVLEVKGGTAARLKIDENAIITWTKPGYTSAK